MTDIYRIHVKGQLDPARSTWFDGLEVQPQANGETVGFGLASFCEQGAHGTSVYHAWGIPFVPGFEQAQVRLSPDGVLEVRAGVHSHGQGMETTLAHHTGKDAAVIRKDTDRDKILTAEEAKEYGIIDTVLEYRKLSAQTA